MPNPCAIPGDHGLVMMPTMTILASLLGLVGVASSPSMSPKTVTPTSSPTQICDLSVWSDVDKSCGPCKAVVYGGEHMSCSEYCASQQNGLNCTAAWDAWTGSTTLCSGWAEATCDAQLGIITDYFVCECYSNDLPYPQATYSPNPYQCDPSQWSDVRYRCTDPCTVLTNRMDTTYGNCENYCNAQGLGCTNAYNADSSGESCVPNGQINCNTTIGWQISNALCQCSGTVAPTYTLTPTVAPSVGSAATIGCNATVWADTIVEVGVECGECEALVANMPTYRTCDKYCSLQQGGLTCAGAWVYTGAQSCSKEYSISCSDDFWIQEGWTEGICRCVAPTSSPTSLSPSTLSVKANGSNNENSTTAIAVAVCLVIGALAGIGLCLYYLRRRNLKNFSRLGPESELGQVEVSQVEVVEGNTTGPDKSSDRTGELIAT